ncbi:MAG: adenylosuccinate lyase [Planctomycetota bacterium]
MTDAHDNWESPLSTRYASAAMRRNFSARQRVLTWRRLWLALAEAQHELGLGVTEAQLAELHATLEDIDFARAAELEAELRHDVMAHVHAWGELAPGARGILHLGATSCFVTDNADLVILRDGVRTIRGLLVGVIRELREFCLRHKDLPCLGRTHYQPAQATTIGKRASLWLQDFVFNLEDLDQAEAKIRFRGVRGTTGTQASFLQLFDGDDEKVRELDRCVTRALGFQSAFGVSGQTYPRQLDFRVCQVLSGIAQSASKFALDVRLASGERELEEPFGTQQIGSSAMPWKRNPMRSERIGAIARHVITLLDDTAHTAANQWFERTLDDSANRRMSLPEMFLGTDAILQLVSNVAAGLQVHEAVVTRRLTSELPFLATEHLLMAAVRAGVDRQDAHERIRVLAREASEAIHRGEDNPLVRLIAADATFAPIAGELERILDPHAFVGRAPKQVEEYVRDEVDPLLERHAELRSTAAEIRV